MPLSQEATNYIQKFQDGLIRGLMWDSLVLLAVLVVIGFFRWLSCRRKKPS
jgi:hypothetical protein